MDVPRAARLQVLAAAALFSTGGAAIKACSLTSWQVAAGRSGIATLALLLLAPAARRGFTRRTPLVGLAYAATVLLFVISNKLTTSANAIFLQSTAPLYVLLIGPFLLREPIRRSDTWFLAALGAGMALFFVGHEAPVETAPNPPLGNVLALTSGFTWALTICGLRWLSGDAKNPGGAAAATVAGNLFALLAALPMALPFADVSVRDAGLVVFLGVFQIGLAYALLTRATSRVTALEVTLLLLLEPVLNPVWSWVVHGERPSAWSLGGGAIILLATLLRARLAGAVVPIRAVPGGAEAGSTLTPP